MKISSYPLYSIEEKNNKCVYHNRITKRRQCESLADYVLLYAGCFLRFANHQWNAY